MATVTAIPTSMRNGVEIVLRVPTDAQLFDEDSAERFLGGEFYEALADIEGAVGSAVKACLQQTRPDIIHLKIQGLLGRLAEFTLAQMEWE